MGVCPGDDENDLERVREAVGELEPVTEVVAVFVDDCDAGSGEYTPTAMESPGDSVYRMLGRILMLVDVPS